MRPLAVAPVVGLHQDQVSGVGMRGVAETLGIEEMGPFMGISQVIRKGPLDDEDLLALRMVVLRCLFR